MDLALSPLNNCRNNFRNQLLSGLRWSGIAQLVQQSLQFLISAILARLLSPQDFGLLGMILVFVGFVSLFSDLGLGTALIQKTSLHHRHLNTVFWVNIVVGGLLTGLGIAFAPFIAEFYDEPLLLPLTRCISFTFFLGSIKVVHTTLFQKMMDFRWIALIEITSVLFAGIVALFMAILGFGVWSLVGQTLTNMVIAVLMTWCLSSWRPTLSFDIGALREFLGFSLNLLGFSVFNYWARNFDNFLIGKLLGSSELGIYSRAYSLMLLPISQISRVVARVMFPVLSSIQQDIARCRQLYLRSTRTIALVTFPLMIGLLVIADHFILAIYGPKWYRVILILRVFCIEGMVQSVGGSVGWIYTSQGRTDIMFKWGIGSGIIRMIAILLGLRWGIIGVATAYLISGRVILWYPSWMIPGRLIQLRFSEMVKNLSGIFYCAIFMGLLIWRVEKIFPQYWSHWIYLAILVPFGASVYWALIHVFRLKAYEEVLGLVAERVKIFRG